MSSPPATSTDAPPAAPSPPTAGTTPAAPPVPLILQGERNRRIVDGTRAVGILMVVLFHTVMGMTQLLPEAGVDAFIDGFPRALNFAWQALGSEIIFFVSGFLLSYLLLKEHVATGRIDVRDYLVRRGSRILPLYALALLLATPLDGPDLFEFVLNVLFVSKIFDESTIIPVGWSLELMVQMYVVLPFLVRLVMRSARPLAWMVGLVLVSVAGRSIPLLLDPAQATVPLWTFLHGEDATDIQRDLYYLTWFRATPFLLGLLMAWLSMFRAERIVAWLGHPGRATGLMLLGLVLTALAGGLPIQDRHSFLYPVSGAGFWIVFWTTHRFVLIVGLCLVILPCFYARGGLPELGARLLSWKPWGLVSRNIYSIYLFHLLCLLPAAALVLWTVDPDELETVSTLQALAIFALGSVLSVLLATRLTRWVETPSQRWLRDRFRRQT